MGDSWAQEVDVWARTHPNWQQKFRRILRLLVGLGLVRTKANIEDPRTTGFKRETGTPWIKMSLPRHAAERQPLIPTDDRSVAAPHSPTEVYSLLQLSPFTTRFPSERSRSLSEGVGRSKLSKMTV